MKPIHINKYLLEIDNRIHWLLIAATAVLLICLGSRELWTQEWRWANISWYMLYSKDYFHPYLAGNSYYDKPLLSYWLMILFSRLAGGLNEWALRLPAAFAGFIAIYCTYQLGLLLENRRTGVIAAWMLTSCYLFIFWARTANADMLNLAGILLALVWYFKCKDKTNFFEYAVFFVILAVTALFKGLIGIAIPLLAIIPNVMQEHSWKKHLNLRLLLAVIPATLIYLLPFWLSSHFGNQHYAENGLYEVYKENVLRYFLPFDHQGPIYTYLIYLPIYMLPWTIFFIPALFSLKIRWRGMNANSRWMVWSTLIIFLFLTFSGSRRNYYVLPLIPFAILMTADWIGEAGLNSKRCRYATYTFLAGYFAIFLSFCVIQPLYYLDGGTRSFAQQVTQAANQIQPWSNWNIVFLDTRSKLSLYLNPTKPITLFNAPAHGSGKVNYASFTEQQLAQAWPILLHLPPHTIFITRQIYLSPLQPYFKNYKIIYSHQSLGERFFPTNEIINPIAFIPTN